MLPTALLRDDLRIVGASPQQLERFDAAAQAAASSEDLQRLAVEIKQEIQSPTTVDMAEVQRKFPPPFEAIRLRRATGRVVGITAHEPRTRVRGASSALASRSRRRESHRQRPGHRRSSSSSRTSSQDPGDGPAPDDADLVPLFRHARFGLINRLMAAFLDVQEAVE